MPREREEKQLLCMEEGLERGTAETIRRRIRPLEQTENHRVSFVSEGARDARMRFRRKLVCWAEAVMRIQDSSHHFVIFSDQRLEINS